jgi:NTP pyrophosphatase (non-canonical NTP hydrolase)
MTYATTPQGTGVWPRGTTEAIATAVLCGSFRRDLETLRADFQALVDHGCNVLSPVSLDWCSERDGFVFLAGEESDEPPAIERRHLSAMRRAHLVWLHSPAGYVGTSAAMEIGYAHALGLPIFTHTPPTDVTLAGMVRETDGVTSALASIRAGEISAPADGLDALQQYYRRAAFARGWSREEVEQCLLLIGGELEELEEAIRSSGSQSREAARELADVQLYVAHLANVMDIGLADAVVDKERVNTARFGPVLLPES